MIPQSNPRLVRNYGGHIDCQLNTYVQQDNLGQGAESDTINFDWQFGRNKPISPPSVFEGFHSFDKQTLLKKDCHPRAFSAT